jgi:hypothetical protein
MILGSVGQVKGVNRSDLDSHADVCVFGKEALIFNDFDREVSVSGYDPSGEKKSLRTVSGRWDISSQKLEECASDYPSSHFSPNIGSQPYEYHANEIAC